MDWNGKWIWLEGESLSQNFWLCARKVFHVQEEYEEAKLHIAADSRYVVWVNVQRIGQGPSAVGLSLIITIPTLSCLERRSHILPELISRKTSSLSCASHSEWNIVPAIPKAFVDHLFQ